MEDKPNSRRHRKKKETTFLETVRELLKTLAVEVADIKTGMKALQQSYAAQQNSANDMGGGYWHDSSGWYPLWNVVGQDDSWTAIDEVLRPTTVSPSPNPEPQVKSGENAESTLSESSPGNFHGMADASYDRNKLLSLRQGRRKHEPTNRIITTSAYTDVKDPAPLEKSEVTVDASSGCAKCGLPVPLDGCSFDGEYGDMCDACDSMLHANCGNAFSNIRGEWNLCPKCLRDFQTGGGSRAVQCDLRSMPQSHWTKLYSRFQIQGKAHCDVLEGSAVGCDDSMQKAADCVQPALQQLEITLDYMVRFLEGEHAKSGKVTREAHSTILGCIKAAMEWQKTPRTDAELDIYNAKLNGVMGEIVRKL